MSSDSFIILSFKSVELNEMIEIDKFHVCSSSHSGSNCRFTRSFWSKHEHNLWKDSSLGHSVNFWNGTSSINVSYFTKFLIVINNWEGLSEIVFNSLDDSFGVIITSSTSFSSF